MSEIEKTKAPAEPKVKAPAEPDGDEYVDYTAPLLPCKRQKDIFGAVNGEAFRVKRGVPVKIKRKFLEALNNAAKQQYAAYQTMDDIRKQGDKPAATM